MMDRKELSFMIKNMRENSGVSKYRASKDSGLTEIQIGYMDDATHSYSIGNMFRYLNAIGGYLQIRSSIYKILLLHLKRCVPLINYPKRKQH